jgi:ribosomal-protein-alanine N-acetyltransferase
VPDHPPGIAIEPMRPDDVDTVVEMERRCFPTAWRPEAFHNELKNERACYLVARRRGKPIGYAGMWVVADEAHITTLAVSPRHRRRGIGARLLRALLAEAYRRGARRITLEVRETNPAAQAMYEKHGFTRIAILRAYYSDTGEDGIVMWINPLPPPEEDTGHDRAAPTA